MSSGSADSSSLRVLVYGGSGALGKAVVTSFKKHGATVHNVDFSVNPEACHNHIVDKDFEASLTKVVKELDAESAKTGGKLFDVVMCAAGGWAGGKLTGETHELLASIDKMYAMNLQTAIASAHIAAKFLKAGGLVVLTGANAARSATSGMIAYGISKSATHQLAQSLNQELNSDSASGTVVTILPITLDTPTNRESMPDGKFSSWTPTSEVGDKIVSWATSERPTSGSMIVVETKDNKTVWTPEKTEY